MPVGTRLILERAAAVNIGDDLTLTERELFMHILSNREAALAWDFSEIGMLRPKVVPP